MTLEAKQLAAAARHSPRREGAAVQARKLPQEYASPLHSPTIPPQTSGVWPFFLSFLPAPSLVVKGCCFVLPVQYHLALREGEIGNLSKWVRSTQRILKSPTFICTRNEKKNPQDSSTLCSQRNPLEISGSTLEAFCAGCVGDFRRLGADWSEALWPGAPARADMQ